MNKFELNWVALIVVFALLTTAIVGLEMATMGDNSIVATKLAEKGEGATPSEGNVPVPSHGSLFFVLVFWTGVVQGCIALVAVADLLKAKWVDPVRRYMLSVYPILLLIPFLFLIFFLFESRALPWVIGGPDPAMAATAEHGPSVHGWFSEKRFMISNLVLLLAVFIVGQKFAKESARITEKRSFWALQYILIYVLCQSMVAFDWVMPLDYPWPSTMFGGFFFLEGGYAALAIAGIVGLMIYRKSKEEFQKGAAGFRDLGGLRLAFSLGWGWFFFSQYLVIWYGNLPEEVEWFTFRAHGEHADLLYPLLCVIVAFILFVPFIAQLPERSKSDPRIFSAISVLMLLTLLLERFVMIAPRVALNPMVLLMEFAIMGVVFLLAMGSRERILDRPYAVSE
ncbi:MAG: hypothetical protein QF645_05205 [Planctomycetota bacterium]|nr:hypothetical protein [Planctomycetota bacterium]